MSNRSLFPVVMKALALGSSVITLVLAAAYHLTSAAWLLPTAISFGTTAYHFCMRLAIGYLIPKLPFDSRHAWFQPRAWEPGFYKTLLVKRWKGKLPTYDPGQFSLENQTPEQILRNMCVSELVHETIMVLSLLPMAFSAVFGAFPVFLSTSLAAALFDSLFVIAQRYNRPRLSRILERCSAKAQK